MPKAQAESVGDDLQRHLQKFQHMKETIEEMYDEMADLVSKREALKTQRQALSTDCSTHQTRLTALQGEIAKLKEERESLLMEVAEGKDKERFWSQYDMSTSTALDEKGKMRRKIWVLEQKVAELESASLDKIQEHENQLDAERAIASGLRDRIGRFEQQTRTQAELLKASAEETASLEAKAMRIATIASDTEEIVNEQLRDARKSLQSIKAEKAAMEAELEILKTYKVDAEGEIRSLKAARNRPATPSRALQPQAINVIRAATPTTPTKLLSPRKSAHADVPMPSSPVFSPTTSLARRYAFLEDRHQKLKAEYDKLRTQYHDDLKHWKEYKAVETARIDLKKKRKAEKKEAKAKGATQAVSSGDTVTPHMQEGADAVGGSQSLAQSMPKDVPWPVLVEEEHETTSQTAGRSQEYESYGDDEVLPYGHINADNAVEDGVIHRSQRPKRNSQRLAQQEPRAKQDVVAQPSARVMTTPKLKAATHSEKSLRPSSSQRVTRASCRQATASPVGRSQQSRTRTEKLHNSRSDAESNQPSEYASHAAQDRPQALVAETLLNVTPGPAHHLRVPPSAARVTPWLGQTSPQKASTPQSASGRARAKPIAVHEDDEDIFGAAERSRATTIRTPLVRDRGGDLDSSLRRTALKRNMSGLRDTSPENETQRKRKHAELEAMSPAEKAATLKKINKMSAAEKREFYADYKGKGRYLPPEELRAGVYDEFEIDPHQNEGSRYQFHDVKRRKEERKQMHGGDCECCKEYYEAVGHIPKFNQGLQWKDALNTDTRDDTGNQAELQEHQNKVSRHRETWRRPPTPPGYWNIGFPTTQEVDKQNATADDMVQQREAQVRREAAHKDSKWRRKM